MKQEIKIEVSTVTKGDYILLIVNNKLCNIFELFYYDGELSYVNSMDKVTSVFNNCLIYLEEEEEYEICRLLLD